MVNFDHGIVPAAIQELKSDLKIDDLALGLLGSLVYLGLMIGSFVSGPLINLIGNKLLICFTICGNLACVIIFPFVKDFTVLSVSRVFVGFF
jgi:MFS family permease